MTQERLKGQSRGEWVVAGRGVDMRGLQEGWIILEYEALKIWKKNFGLNIDKMFIILSYIYIVKYAFNNILFILLFIGLICTDWPPAV